MNEFNNFPTEKKEPKLGWSWGAFMLSVPFAFGNGAYLALLTLIPGVNLIWFFVSGAQGARWAYESGKFANIDEFNGAMDSWNRAGKVMAIICLVLFVFYILLINAITGFFFPYFQ